MAKNTLKISLDKNMLWILVYLFQKENEEEPCNSWFMLIISYWRWPLEGSMRSKIPTTDFHLVFQSLILLVSSSPILSLVLQYHPSKPCWSCFVPYISVAIFSSFIERFLMCSIACLSFLSLYHGLIAMLKVWDCMVKGGEGRWGLGTCSPRTLC